MEIQEIEMEIERLESAETTYENIGKLSMLYVVRDHLGGMNGRMAEYSEGSEFMKAVSSSPIDHVIEVMDEHMNAIMLLYPKEYSAILSKIKDF